MGRSGAAQQRQGASPGAPSQGEEEGGGTQGCCHPPPSCLLPAGDARPAPLHGSRAHRAPLRGSSETWPRSCRLGQGGGGGGGGRMDAWTKGQPGGTRAHTAGRQAGRRAVLEIWSRLTARARKAPSHPRTHRQDGRGGRAHKCNAPLLARGCRGQAAAGEQGMGGQRAVAPASACAARQHPGSSGCSSLSTAEKADLQSQSSPTGIRSRGAPLWCLCGLPPAGTRRQRAAAAGIPRSQCSHASRPLAAPPPSLALPPVHPTSRIRSVRR